MGFCSKAEHQRFLTLCPRMERRGAGAAICGAHRRSAAAMEAQSDGYRVIPALVRLLPSARQDAQGHSLEGSAWHVVRSDDKRKSPPQLHFSYPGAHSLQAHLARACQIAFTIREGKEDRQRGYDPTNNKLVSSEHIPVAVLREHEKASPLSGSWDGPADAINRMNVSVQVVPIQ
jgi:hypothetical protein